MKTFFNVIGNLIIWYILGKFIYVIAGILILYFIIGMIEGYLHPTPKYKRVDHRHKEPQLADDRYWTTVN